MQKILKFILFLGVFSGLYFFCDSQTKGFRLHEILSDIPNDPRWDVPAPQNAKEVTSRLNQTFKYLGSGKQCHAFLGEDGKTVLKLFRHNDLSFLKIVNHFPQAFHQWYWNRIETRYDPVYCLESSKIAYEKLQNQTGIFFLHINKTQDQFGPVILKDNIGVSHQVNLDSTEFLVQEYCELAVSRIEDQMKSGNLSAAASSVKAIFQAIEEWSKLGVHIDNPALRRNIGFSGDQVIMLDAGSLTLAEENKEEARIKKHIQKTMHGLGRWIRKKHPDLYPYFREQLNEKS